MRRNDGGLRERHEVCQRAGGLLDDDVTWGGGPP